MSNINSVVDMTHTKSESLSKENDSPISISQPLPLPLPLNIDSSSSSLSASTMSNDEEFNLLNYQPVVNVGVLGHVAHGKSTLVKQITGIKTQKFATEQKSGRTVKLGYANVKIFKCDTCTTFFTRPSDVMTPPPCEICSPHQQQQQNCIVQSITFSGSSLTDSGSIITQTVTKTKVQQLQNSSVTFSGATLTDSGSFITQTVTKSPHVVMTKLVNHVSFVDCPGHEMMMTTMLNGTAVMDAAMLVIAANENFPQLQTQEHLIAAELMGLNNILLVQNKIDLVNTKAVHQNSNEISEWVKGTCAEGSPVVPISAQFGYGVQKIIEALANLKPANRKHDIAPIFACIRSFDINKPGATVNELNGGVIGGTLLQGTLAVGDQVKIQPGFKCSNSVTGETQYVPFVTKITSIRSEGNELSKVIPGGLIAIGTFLDPFFTTKDALVGCILGTDLPPLQTDITIKYMTMKSSDLKLFKVGDSVRITALSRTVQATVTEVIPKVSKMIKVKLSEPLCLVDGYSKFSISVQQNKQWRLVGVANLVVDGKVVKQLGHSEPDFGRTLPEYLTLYNDITSKHKLNINNIVKQLRLDPPICARRGGARTAWINFGANVKQLGRPMEHVRHFVSNELATETSVSEKEELILYGNISPEKVESILRSYIKTYCKCSHCGNCATNLQEDSNSDIVICSYCGRNNIISSTKQAIPKKGKGGKIKII